MRLVQALAGHWRRLCRALADHVYVDTETGSHHAALSRLGAISASWLSYGHWPQAARHPFF